MRRETLGTRYPSTLRTSKHLRGYSVGLKAEGDLAAAAWLRCCYARGQAQDFPDEGDDRRGKAPPLLSAQVGCGGARERHNCELCGHGSRVHVGRDVGSSYRVVYPFPRDATRKRRTREKCVCGTHKNIQTSIQTRVSLVSPRAAYLFSRDDVSIVYSLNNHSNTIDIDSRQPDCI